jgi:N-acyl-D-aspartate/D-glutamate deacylase
MYDLVIRGGTVVDGLRTPRYRADIGVQDGRIATIGRISGGSGRREIDAGGLVVAPGFVDLHTHYDSQIFWDPWCTISGWHGVTSVVIGNCGFGFAPCTPAGRDRAMLTMARNEAVPLESMQAGMPWDWETYPEFLDSIERTPKGVNVLSYVGLNPLMAYVMGVEAAKARPANDGERAEMCRLLGEAMAAGACGFSAQISGEGSVQRDHDGTPMITDTMSEADLLAFCAVLAELGRGTVQVAGTLESAEAIATVSGRPVIWNILAAATDQHGAPATAHDAVIERIDRANRDGGLRIFAQALTADVRFEFTLEEWNLFDSSALWREVTLGSIDERLDKMADPVRRQALREEYDAGRGPVAGGGTEERDVRVGTGISELLCEWVSSDAPAELKKYEGHTVGQIAEMTGSHPVDAMLDLAVASRLKTGFATPVRGTNVDSMRSIVNSDYALPGVSDGGAHTKFITLGAYPTEFLTKWVRTHELLSLEDAHWRLSGYPALAAGFKDRGWLKEGSPADIVVYDFDNLTELDAERAYDYPAGAWRLVKKADGYRHTIVNGVETFTDGECTGATPGSLLRHGTNV